MKILSLDISVEDKKWFDEAQPGRFQVAAPLQMKRLGDVVLVAGPNGSGKTRLFRSLHWLLMHRQSNASVEPKIRLDLWRQANLALSELPPKLEGDDRIQLKFMPGGSLEQTASQWKSWIAKNWLNYRVVEAITMDIPTGDSRPINFLPATSGMIYAISHSEDQIASFAQQAVSPGFGDFDPSRTTTAYLHATFKRAFEATHPEAEGVSNYEKQRLCAAKESLNDLLVQLLGKDAKPHYNATTRSVWMFNQPTFHEAVSSGQRMLLHLAVAIHAQGASLKSSILFLDEPETHLHPSALIQVVKTLLSVVTDGQLWIATHCVPLIAYLTHRDPNCVWYTENGKISHAARTPKKLIDGLLGGDEAGEYLKRFAERPAQHAMNQFLEQCLVPPGVVGPDVHDPQTNQIFDLIQGLRSGSTPLRLLDCGAGQGRLLTTLSERGSQPVSEWLDYFAVEPGSSHKGLIETIQAAYSGNAEGRLYSKMADLEAAKDAGSVHVAVLCNVLHEIDPAKWVEEFGLDSRLHRVLHKEGYLLVVEDYGLPIGELANPAGFLLLDEPELKKLFAVTEKDVSEKKFIRAGHTEDRYKNRLVAHLLIRPK